MKVVATIAASGKGLKSSCAVDIQCGGFKHSRVIPFAKATVNQAELFALGYVLASIKTDLNVQFEITTFNTYVGRILEKDAQGQYVITPEKNIQQVNLVRELLGKWPASVVIEKTPGVIALREIIKTTVTANA